MTSVRGAARRTMRTILTMTALLALCMLLTGCYEIAYRTVVDNDGSGSTQMTILVPSALGELDDEGLLEDESLEDDMGELDESDDGFEDEDAEDDSSSPDPLDFSSIEEAADAEGVKYKAVERGDKIGFTVTSEFDDADEFAEAFERINSVSEADSDDSEDEDEDSDETSSADSIKFTDAELEVDRDLLGTTYRLKAEMAPLGSDTDELGMSAEEYQSLLKSSGFSFTFSTKMPGKVVETNGKTNKKGDTVTWDVDMTADGEVFKVETRRTSPVALIALVGGGALVVLILLVVVVRSARRKARAGASAAPVVAGAVPAPAPVAAQVDATVSPAPAPSPAATPAYPPVESASATPAAPGTKRFCEGCGTPLGEGVAFCGSCGRPVG